MRAIDKARAFDAVYAKTGGRCAYCGRRLYQGVADIEHMTPKSRGGTDSIRNLVIACRQCNSRKAMRTVDEYRASVEGGLVFWGDSYGVFQGIRG